MRAAIIAALVLAGCSDAPAAKQAFAQCRMRADTEVAREPISGFLETTDFVRFQRLCMATKGFEESGACEPAISALGDTCYRRMR